MSDDVPYTKELDPHVDGKGSLELHAQPAAFFIVPRIHFVREWQLFAVAWGEKSDFLEHAREGASCKGATREPKNTYLISHAI